MRGKKKYNVKEYTQLILLYQNRRNALYDDISCNIYKLTLMIVRILNLRILNSCRAVFSAGRQAVAALT